MKKSIILNALFYLVLSANAQPKMTVPEYIQKYQKTAIEEMQYYKIPASITLAQGILESANGNSELARNANNHFGIKCKIEWKGGKYYYDDDAKNECFRKYKTDMDSYRDHSVFLATREYYKALFLLDIKDYKGWAYGLKKAGYATEPKYAEMLIKIIEDNKLYQLDSGVIVITKDSLVSKDSIANNKINNTKNEVVRIPDSLQKVERIKEIKNAPSDFPDIQLSAKSRKILVNNGVKYVLAVKKDTYKSIAESFDLAEFDILRYNDIKNNSPLLPGDKIYVESKKKAATVEFHVVVAGETMHAISQLYAVQLKELCKKNHMKQGKEPKKGQKIWLEKTMPVN